MLQALNLSMNKSTTNLSRVELRDSDKGEILESFILNSDGTPYDLSGKSLVFNENKDGDKFVSDPNVTIVDARIGHITYQLHDQVHSAPGTAWFDIIQDGAKIDSTTDFYIEVRDGLKCTVYNTTYISDLEKLKRQMEALIQQAEGELKAELQKAEQQLNQELQNFRTQYNSLSADFQNQFKTAQNARQQDYNNQKDAINADWLNTKNNINKNALDTINAIKSNAKQVLDEDQANWNAKQTQWDSTFSAIVKEWQVKTNSLNATVQDLTNKFNTIIGQVSDLINNKLPTMNAKADAIQAKVNELRASLGQIDWISVAHKTDNSGGVNLLANTATFIGFNNFGNVGVHDGGYGIDVIADHKNETNINLVKTRIMHIYGDAARYAPLGFSQNVFLTAGTYTLSFVARTNQAGQPDFHFSLYSDWTDQHGGAPLGTSDGVNSTWGRHSLTFTVPQDHEHASLRLQQYDDAPLPGGALYFANLKLESGSIATDWCQSYLDFDRLDGQHDPIDAPDFNNLTSTGIYMITQPDHGKNYPTANWGILKVDNADDNRIEQEYYEDVANGSIYHRQCVDGSWRPWKKVASIDDVNTRLPLAGGSMNKGSFINWNGGGINDRSGNIGGLLWQGATDNIRIFADENGNDNLDLAIQLGDDNSNHISIRDKDGTERAAITADGQFTGRTDWAYVINTGIHNPTLGRLITNSNTWNDIIGEDNGDYALTAIRDESNGQGNTIGNFSSGIVFGGSDTKGILNVAYNIPQARIIGGNGNGPVWHKDIAWKDDLKINVVRSYDIEKNQAGPVTSETLGSQWVVDEGTLAAFADAHRDVRNHTDFRYPTDITSNTAINLNNDPYLDTGIYKIENCAIINGPWAAVDARRWLFLRVAKYDDNSIFQTINYNNGELYSRCVSKTNNSYPEWSKFATMNSINDLSDRLQNFTMQQAMFQHRVDYDSPSGTISDDTVDFNNYRETGILKVVNCLIQNGPYKSDDRHTVFLKITNLDGQTQYQTVYEGDNLYGRKLYNGSGQWHKYTNTPI